MIDRINIKNVFKPIFLACILSGIANLTAMISTTNSSAENIDLISFDFENQKHYIAAIAFNVDGKWLAAGYNGTVTLLNTETNECKPVFDIPNTYVHSVAFSQDGKWLAAGYTNTIKLWNMKTKKCGPVFINESGSKFCSITSITFSPNGKQLILGDNFGTVKLWNLETNGCELMFSKDNHGYNDPSTVISLAHDPNYILIAIAKPVPTCDLLYENPIKWLIWDITTKGITSEAVIPDENSSGLSEAAFSPDRKWLASVGRGKWLPSERCGGIVKLWNTQTNECTHTFEYDRIVKSIAFSPNGAKIAVGFIDGKLAIHNVVINALQKTTIKLH
jgi:WD40 repeat protein